jgi:hypothetical protein
MTNEEVILGPLQIGEMSGIVQQIESVEDHGEKSVPLGVVVRLHVEGVRDKRLDGDAVEGLRQRSADRDAGGRRHGRWSAVGCRRKSVADRWNCHADKAQDIRGLRGGGGITGGRNSGGHGLEPRLVIPCKTLGNSR